MITLDDTPRTKNELPARTLNWVVQPASRIYTSMDFLGDLAKEIDSFLESSKIEPDPIPNVAPEDFESIYRWFIS